MVVSWSLLLILSAPGRPMPASPAKADVPAQPRPARSDGDEVMLGRYRLKPKKGGGYRADTDQFIAHVAADGAVSFEERPRIPGAAVLPALIIGELMESRCGSAPRDPIDAAKRQVLRPNLILSEDDLRNDPRHGPKMDFLNVTAHFREGLQRGNDRSGLSSCASGWTRWPAIAGCPPRSAASRSSPCGRSVRIRRAARPPGRWWRPPPADTSPRARPTGIPPPSWPPSTARQAPGHVSIPMPAPPPAPDHLVAAPPEMPPDTMKVMTSADGAVMGVTEARGTTSSWPAKL